MSDEQDEALRELAELVDRLNTVLDTELEVPIALRPKEEE